MRMKKKERSAPFLRSAFFCAVRQLTEHLKEVINGQINQFILREEERTEVKHREVAVTDVALLYLPIREEFFLLGFPFRYSLVLKAACREGRRGLRERVEV